MALTDKEVRALSQRSRRYRVAELTGAQALSTDRLRRELFGDAAVQGPWRDIEGLLHQRIHEPVADGVPVMVDATNARRPWRLAITQALALPAPVEWIGWWLFTSLATCLEWNHTRSRLVSEPVIREMAAASADPFIGPSRAEGFAAVVAVVPTQVRELEPLLRDELARLDHRIRSARNRENRFDLHGHLRLLDLERLLHLLHLLSTYPELSAEDPATLASASVIAGSCGGRFRRRGTPAPAAPTPPASRPPHRAGSAGA